MLDTRKNASNIIQQEKKAKEMLDEFLNLFKFSCNIFYKKSACPTSSNIVRKRIQHFLSNMLDGVEPTFGDWFSLAFISYNSNMQKCAEAKQIRMN